MALFDHFRPPLSVHHPWQSIHSAWANAMVRQLNEGLLPGRYYALPNVQPGGRLEIDVATIERSTAEGPVGAGVTIAVWAPPRPALAIPIPEVELDVFEVQVLDAEQGRLVSAVELISPANKDRPDSRRALAVKCAALLLQGVSVGIVDVVTRRRANWHSELTAILHTSDPMPNQPLELCAFAYRLRRDETGSSVEAWTENLAVGADLPLLPLWLGPDIAIPLDLDQSYAAMCVALRLHD